MPSNLIVTPPSVVMPQGLMSAFSEEAEWPVLIDAYPVGEASRATLAAGPRKVFRLTRRLTGAQWTALWDFLAARNGASFWFYNLRETQPAGSWDPSGANPVGRYAVVIQATVVRSTDLGRGSVGVELREVASA